MHLSTEDSPASWMVKLFGEVCGGVLEYISSGEVFQGGTSFVDLLCFFCLVFAMSLCASVYMCFVVTCWDMADLLALVCGV